LHKKALFLVCTSIAAVTSAACSEKLDAGRSCPLLCPQQSVSLADTTFDAIEVDTTVLGLPPIGNEAYLMLSSHGDTLETRAIVRFDTLPQSYTKNTIDSVITHLDSAILVTPIAKPDSLKRPKAPVTIEAYNVDTTGTDTSAVILGSLFRPDRFLGSKTFAPESLLDTLHPDFDRLCLCSREERDAAPCRISRVEQPQCRHPHWYITDERTGQAANAGVVRYRCGGGRRAAQLLDADWADVRLRTTGRLHDRSQGTDDDGE